MSVIREDDVIASVADVLQYISYYHTPDFIRAMGHAYAIEKPSFLAVCRGPVYSTRLAEKCVES